jgi:hypothetical protein
LPFWDDLPILDGRLVLSIDAERTAIDRPLLERGWPSA